MNIDTLTGIIVDAAFKIHTSVGPGCYEQVGIATILTMVAKKS